MTRQKVVIRVSMVDQKKSRTRAMKIAATAFGVQSVALGGRGKDHIVVTGEGIDAVKLAKLLRKKVGCADLISVRPAKAEDNKSESMASKSSPTPVSSSAPNSALTWDVFLSYRGPDTGTTFTAHLYDALHRHGIQTYKDDYKLRLGEDITDALRDAIKESKIYIVVFSTGYATSRWCLDELVDIVRFKETEKRLIIPVFHHIDPSIVRHGSGNYEEALKVHEKGHYKNQIQKVDSWRAALKVAANVSGEHVCDKNSLMSPLLYGKIACN